MKKLFFKYFYSIMNQQENNFIKEGSAIIKTK